MGVAVPRAPGVQNPLKSSVNCYPLWNAQNISEFGRQILLKS